MKKLTSILAALVMIGVVSPAAAEEAAGDWGGVLGGMLHVVVHIGKDPNGHYTTTLESPDQGR